MVWAVIAGIGLLRVGFGLWRIHAIRRQCVSMHLSELDESVRDCIARFRPNRSVAVLQSEAVRVPSAIGFFRPAVVIPAWCLRELAPAELSAILIHEFAHLRRWDDWTNFLQKILRALFFFHPAVWWLESRLALEREMACDDLVLEATENARAYAECLVSLAEKSVVLRGLALAQGLVHRVQHMSLRVSQIMDAKRPRAARVWMPAIPVVFCAACVVAVQYTPALIAFQASAKDVASAIRHDFGPAQMIPATTKVKPGQMNPAALNAKAGKRAHTTRNPILLASKPKMPRTLSPAAVLAKANDRMGSQARVVPAKAGAGTQNAVGSVLLVVRDQMVDPTGRIIWTMSVWQVTVYHPASTRTNQGPVAKAI
jgi:beta-lactamase regulating signal transducer with metallopeptidase domain